MASSSVGFMVVAFLPAIGSSASKPTIRHEAGYLQGQKEGERRGFLARPGVGGVCSEKIDAMAQEPQMPLPDARDLAKELADVRTVGVGRLLRKDASVDQLVAVARELADDPSLPREVLIDEAIRGVIKRRREGKIGKAIALEFGADQATEDERKLEDRRRRAATELGINLDTLIKKYDARMCLAIAEDLLSLLRTRRSDDETTRAPHGSATAASPIPPKPPVRPPSRKTRPVIAGFVGVMGLLVWLMLSTFLATSGKPETPPTLVTLAAETTRSLGLNEIPVPGASSGALGFGDSVGGRPTYPFVPEAPTTNTPFFDSMVDMGGSNPDERMFIHAAAVSLHDFPPLKRYKLTAQSGYQDVRQMQPTARAVRLTQHEAVLVGVLVDNQAGANIEVCDHSTSYDAHDARLRLVVWDSPTRRSHVVRAWLDADNTNPRWVSDAVAVVTAIPAHLVADPTRSGYVHAYEYPGNPQAHRISPPRSFALSFQSAGMSLGSVGVCTADQFEVSMIFRQS